MSERKPPLRVVPVAKAVHLQTVMQECLELIHPKISGMHAVLVLLDRHSVESGVEVASTFSRPSDSALILEDAARQMRKLPNPEDDS